MSAKQLPMSMQRLMMVQSLCVLPTQSPTNNIQLNCILNNASREKYLSQIRVPVFNTWLML